MPKPIMLVEDDRVYAIWVRNALNKLNVPNKLIHAANGRLALEYLRDKANARPCLILLDLYMPELNGVEFLRVIKSDCALRHIPVVVLTASPQEADVAMSFELGAAEYLKKGGNYSDLLYKMSRLVPYWTGIQVCFDPEPASIGPEECTADRIHSPAVSRSAINC